MRLNREIKQRNLDDTLEIESVVREILSDVRVNGDEAVRKYARKFDGYEGEFLLDLSSDSLQVGVNEDVDENFIRILERAKAQIEGFHKNQLGESWEIAKENGVVMGQIVRPINRVAIYVPGGTAAYPSTVLMNAIPAKIAGVPEIAMFCPNPNAEVIAAARVCGVNKIYKIGGVQAIAAAAFGTESIPKFDKIVGPGNAFVATAKRIVYGEVDIDMVAGPSEILVIADENANPKYIAADLMSQAEHDKMASSILLTTSEELINEVERELDTQINKLVRKDIIEESLKNFGAAILVSSLDEAFELSNEIAPEHLEVLVDEPMKHLPKITNAGSIFLGEYTPEPLGDYMSGTNHVLPTGGTAKFYSPLGVYSFVKFSSYSYYPRQELSKFKDDVIEFATKEGLDAHANSIKVRFQTQVGDEANG
ncbi:MAG: histidinol dehydrogenase [Clostridiales bacterium]|jgi:histidinol dehydrogenase|nr:histidinol dehydrogenase [Clostridiales bacterium]